MFYLDQLPTRLSSIWEVQNIRLSSSQRWPWSLKCWAIPVRVETQAVHMLWWGIWDVPVLIHAGSWPGLPWYIWAYASHLIQDVPPTNYSLAPKNNGTVEYEWKLTWASGVSTWQNGPSVFYQGSRKGGAAEASLKSSSYCNTSSAHFLLAVLSVLLC